MTKNDFIIKYGIADTTPIDPSHKELPAESLANGILDFMNGKFKGAVETSIDQISPRAATVCPDYMAYFFKILITAVHGREMIYLRIRTTAKNLIISIHLNSPVELDRLEERELIRAARNAGFEINLGHASLELSAKLGDASFRRVYAISIVNGKRLIMDRMLLMFCTEEKAKLGKAPHGR